MRRITSRKSEWIRAFRTIARNPSDLAPVLLDGAHLVREADRAGWMVSPVMVLDSLADSDTEAGALARDLEARGAEVYAVSRPVMDAASPVKSPSGIVALAVRPLPDIRRLFEENPHALAVVAMDVQDPGNVGAIVRSAEAMGAHAVLVAGSALPFGWKALRGSMGSALRLPVSSLVPNRDEDLVRCARSYGFRVVVSTPRDGKAPDAIDWRGRVALFVGGEGPGLSDAIVGEADERVTISMTPHVESLNVAVATALLLYEARRQRS